MILSRFGLNLRDVGTRSVEGARHQLVHRHRLLARHKVGLMAVAAQESRKLVLGNPGEYRRPCDLVAVQVENRQHRAIACRVEKLVRVPACGERARLCLTIAHYAAGNEVWIVEYGAVCMEKRIAELTAFVNRSGRFG